MAGLSLGVSVIIKGRREYYSQYFRVSVGRDTSCDVISCADSVLMLPKNAAIFKQEIMVVKDYSVPPCSGKTLSLPFALTNLINTLSWRA